jgi:hypothetical protein
MLSSWSKSARREAFCLSSSWCALSDSSPRGVGVGYPLRRYARLVGAPHYAPSLCSVAGLLLALALESGYEGS